MDSYVWTGRVNINIRIFTEDDARVRTMTLHQQRIIVPISPFTELITLIDRLYQELGRSPRRVSFDFTDIFRYCAVNFPSVMTRSRRGNFH